ncbi:SDR family oxidoreductase [bacterium]|nr:SDR family oxidoreductase [bacterium]
MKVLITGGNGFIGGRLAKYLLSFDKNIIYIASRDISVKKLTNVSDLNYTYINWDSAEVLNSVCANMDVIIHLAGMNASECSKNPVDALYFNGVCTARLIESAINQNVKRFILVSTAHVYGSPLKGNISEIDKLCPVNPYATSNRAAEDLVFTALKNKRIEGLVLRLSNGYGAPAKKNVNCWNLLIPHLCRQSINQKILKLNSNGLQRRDFITITDVCRAIDHFINLRQEKIGEGLFNVGGDWSPTVFEVAESVQECYKDLYGIKLPIMRENNLRKEVSVPFTYSIERLKKTGYILQKKGKKRN